MKIENIPGRSFVYVVGADIGPKKIGIAKDFRKRLSQYKTHNVQNIKPLYVRNLPSAKAKWVETTVHHRLAPHRDHGEWFNVTQEIAISTIKEAAFEARHPDVSFQFETYLGATRGAFVFLYDWPKPTPPRTPGLLVAQISIAEYQRKFKISFAEGRFLSDRPEAQKLAPQKYRRNFRDITKCMEYVEKKIFEAVESAMKESS